MRSKRTRFAGFRPHVEPSSLTEPVNGQDWFEWRIVVGPKKESDEMERGGTNWLKFG